MIDESEMDNDDICELYDLTPGPYVKRSLLYHLPPVGVGTPYVESLTSYINRLAQAHHVLPESLVKHVIIPVLDSPVISKQQQEKLGIIWKRNTRTLNGINATASSWIHVLEQLTLRNDLQFLTMLPWSNVLSKTKLVRHYRAWCPYCFEEKKQLGHIIYEPLIWCVDAVKICSIHNISLTIHCPNPRCQQLTSPFTAQMRPGYCSQCQSWLGEDSKVERTPSQNEYDSVDQAWLVQAVQELLVAAPLLPNVISRQQAAAAFQPYLDQFAEGTISILARHVRQKNAAGLRGWIKGRSMPRFAAFLDICYQLKTTPLAFLTQDPDVLLIEKGFQSIDTGTGIIRRTQHGKIKQLQQLLEEMLTEYPPLSLKEVARKLERTPRLLKSYFPDISQEIVVRYRGYLGKMRIRTKMEDILSIGRDLSIQMILDKLQCTDQFLQQEFPDLWEEIIIRYERTVDVEAKRIALETALIDEHCTSLGVVAKSVGCSVKALRQDFPKLSRLVDSRHRASFNFEVVRQQLEAILNDPNQVLSLSEIFRQTGYNGGRIRQYFPDLCAALVKKYSFPNLEFVQKELENALALSTSTRGSLERIARRVGYSSDKIKLNFPGLSAAIMAKHKFDVELFQQTLENILASNIDPLPSLRSIALSLDVTEATLRSNCPSLCKQITGRRKLQLSKQDIQKYLEEALISTITPPVSCAALARQLGVSAITLLNRYPDLYKALVERYRDYRHKNKLARENHIKIQVQIAIDLAAAESPFPSISRVTKHLPKPSMVRDSKVASMIRDGLKNLTYREDVT